MNNAHPRKIIYRHTLPPQSIGNLVMAKNRFAGFYRTLRFVPPPVLVTIALVHMNILSWWDYAALLSPD